MMSICYSLEDINNLLKDIDEPEQLISKKLTPIEQFIIKKLVIERVISDGIENIRHRSDILVHHNPITKENFVSITRVIPMIVYTGYYDKALEAVMDFHQKRIGT